MEMAIIANKVKKIIFILIQLISATKSRGH